MPAFILRRRVLKLIFAAAICAVTAADVEAQSSVRVTVSATIAPLVASSNSRTIKVKINDTTTFRLDLPPNSTQTTTSDIGSFYIDEGGSAVVATIEGTNVVSGYVNFYLADRSDDFVVMTNGRQNPLVSLTSGDTMSSAAITVFNKRRLQSTLGSGSSGNLVGSCSSPYLKPTNGPWDDPINVFMDINLGLTQSGQPLPPLRVDYLDIGWSLPEHHDIVPDAANPVYGYPRKYRLPQATCCAMG